jgi:hypothetical protein
MCGRFTYKLTWSEIPRLEWGWRDDIQARLPKWGLEGIVSKRRDLAYRSGRTKSWMKVKNPNSPAVLRIQHGSW